MSFRGSTKPFVHKLLTGYSLLVLTLASTALYPKHAHASCSLTGGSASCTANDTDGFSNIGDITNITVGSSATVDDSGTEVTSPFGGGAFGIIGVTGFITGTVINNGTITDTGVLDDDGIGAQNIENLINNGVINAGVAGVFASIDIESLTNNGTITGGDDGVAADDDINFLRNNGTIIGADDGVYAADDITHLENFGTIEGNFAGVNADNDINYLVNYGTIIGNQFGVYGGSGRPSDGIQVLINAGTITGTTSSITSDGDNDTVITLLPGSNLSGDIDMGTGTNTFEVGSGLSVDTNFTALPNIINTGGAPFVTNGTRVVVADTTQLAQSDDVFLDIGRGVWNTVFNHIRDGRSSGPTTAALGGLTSQMSFAGNNNPNAGANHVWAAGFGGTRAQNGTSGSGSARHLMGGAITGVGMQLDKTTRMGVFIGTSTTDVKTVRSQQNAEPTPILLASPIASPITNIRLIWGY